MCSLRQFRRLWFPGLIHGHNFLRSAMPAPTTTLSFAVAFDDHNIKMAPIIRMIFTTERSSYHRWLNIRRRRIYRFRRFDIELNQMKDRHPDENHWIVLAYIHLK